MIRWFLHALTFVSFATVGGVATALVALLLGRWKLVTTVAGWSAASGAAVFALIGILVVGMWITPNAVAKIFWALAPPADRDPSQKARIIAESISETMNCGALACLAGLVAAILWGVARWRISIAPG